MAAKSKYLEIPTDPFKLQVNREQIPYDDEQRAREEQQRKLFLETMREELTDIQYDTVYLYYFEGQTEEQIALTQGVTQQNVNKCIFGKLVNGKRIGGALTRLREALTTKKGLY